MLNEGLSLLSAGGGLFIAVITLYVSLQASGVTQPFQKLILGISMILLSGLAVVLYNYGFINNTEVDIAHIYTLLVACIGYSIGKFLNTFIWTGIFYPKGIEVPKLITKFVNAFVYVLTIICIQKFVHGQSIMHFLALFGGFAAIIGYTAADTIGQVFAGLAINVGGNIKKGDFIQIGNDAGTVREMDWRSITLIDWSKRLIVIPNSSAAHSRVINFTKINKVLMTKTDFKFPGHINTNHIISILKEAMEDFGLKPNQYSFNLAREKDYYHLTIKMEAQFESYWSLPSNFMQLFSHKLQLNNILLDYNAVSDKNNILKPTSKLDRPPITDVMPTLKKILAFTYLNAHETAIIKKYAKIKVYSPHSIIAREGDDAHTLMVCLDGDCNVYQLDSRGQNVWMRSLHQGEYFGIQSFLTGSKRRITVVSLSPVTIGMLSPFDISEVVKGNKKFSNRLAEVLAQRVLQNESKLEKNSKALNEKKNSLIASIMTTFVKMVGKK
ncbi:MAG TPA: mechanosensitive ion channel [Gammaproteobacteria bacterium]|nr:mechanosensitive ion channel [Gammaproteobacteria bacterium]